MAAIQIDLLPEDVETELSKLCSLDIHAVFFTFYSQSKIKRQPGMNSCFKKLLVDKQR